MSIIKLLTDLGICSAARLAQPLVVMVNMWETNNKIAYTCPFYKIFNYLLNCVGVTLMSVAFAFG
mgnify:CR=1 FL=1